VIILIFVSLQTIEAFPFNYHKAEAELFGAEVGFSETKTVRTSLLSLHLYDLPIGPIELNFDLLTMAFTFNEKTPKVSYINFIIFPMSCFPGFFVGPIESFWGFGPVGIVLAAPQLLGNFKIHLPIKKERLYLYMGETTDYYLYQEPTIFTESKVGVRIIFEPVSLDIALCKPWLKGYLTNDKIYLGCSIGWYRTRTTEEKINHALEEKE
jgi:hypothetical protein